MKHRLFISIDFPKSLYPAVSQIRSQVTKLKVPVVWEDDAKLHLTLNFIGRVDDDQLTNLRGNVKAVANQFTSFSLTPTFLESLYSRHDGSMLYLAPTGDVELLKELQSTLGDRLGTLLLPKQSRFLPHIKIGTYQKADPTTTKQFMDRMSQIQIEPLPAFTVDRIFLMESTLSKSGSHYQVLDRFMLKSPIV